LPPVLALLQLVAAVQGDEPSKTPFVILGGLLVLFALCVSAVGIRGHETFPSSRGAQRAVLGLAVLLVAGAMATAVITA
jgi:hypothetical protein